MASMAMLSVDIRSVLDPAQLPVEDLPGLTTLVALTSSGLIVAGLFFFWLTRRLLAPRTIVAQPAPRLSQVAGGALILVGTYLCAQMFGGQVGMEFAGYTPLPDGPKPTPDQYHRISIVHALIVMLTPIPYVLYLRSGAMDSAHIQPRAIGKRAISLPLLCLAWVVLSIATGWFAIAVRQAFGMADDTQKVLDNIMQPGEWQLIAAIVSPVIAAPLAEEFLFRAGIFGLGRRALGFWPAAVIATALFTGAHMNPDHPQPQYIVPIAVLGLSLCWVYEQSRNIWFPIALHAFHNGATLLVFGVL